MIPTVDKDGSFLSWAYIAYDEMTWSIIINNLESNSFKSAPE